MFVYVEFISRLPGADLASFYEAARDVPNEWADEHTDDRLILNIGRTWRIGPEPSYIHAWFNDGAGTDRLDDWQRIFSAGEASALEERFGRVARVDRAGLYEALLPPVQCREGLYYGEYFDFRAGVEREAVAAFFRERVERHSDATLSLLVDRKDGLGPDPRGLAVWEVPRWTKLDTLTGEVRAAGSPIELVTSALYADTGQEIL
jgi:hypothetical protein